MKSPPTVDGSEIRRSPVDIGKYPIIYMVLYIQKVVGLGISEPSAPTSSESEGAVGFANRRLSVFHPFPVSSTALWQLLRGKC